MRRTTIVASKELLDRLQTVAHERGASMATPIREAIGEKLERQRPKPGRLGIVDSGRSDLSELASEARHFEPHSWR